MGLDKRNFPLSCQEWVEHGNEIKIAELNAQYADLPGDFSDLALIAISERLNIAAIATLDHDFDFIVAIGNNPSNESFDLKSNQIWNSYTNLVCICKIWKECVRFIS